MGVERTLGSPLFLHIIPGSLSCTCVVFSVSGFVSFFFFRQGHTFRLRLVLKLRCLCTSLPHHVVPWRLPGQMRKALIRHKLNPQEAALSLLISQDPHREWLA